MVVQNLEKSENKIYARENLENLEKSRNLIEKAHNKFLYTYFIGTNGFSDKNFAHVSSKISTWKWQGIFENFVWETWKVLEVFTPQFKFMTQIFDEILHNSLCNHRQQMLSNDYVHDLYFYFVWNLNQKPIFLHFVNDEPGDLTGNYGFKRDVHPPCDALKIRASIYDIKLKLFR